MAIRVTLECGHTSELRAQRTPEGYTHDWQVFVRGVDNAEVHQYIEKGIFLFIACLLLSLFISNFPPVITFINLCVMNQLKKVLNVYLGQYFSKFTFID